MKLSVDYWQDPKFSGLGTTHEAFYVRLLAYTRKFETDGFIPAVAIALCGRRIYNRDKVLADLLKAGLIERNPDLSSAEDIPYLFPKTWHKYSARQVKTPGQGPAHVRAEERRKTDRSKDLGSSSLAQAPVRIIDGMRMQHFPGTGWVKVDGTGAEHEAAQKQGSPEGTAAVPNEQQGS